MPAKDQLRELLKTALMGDITPMLRGIGISQRGKLEIFARLAYIAGIRRAIEIIENSEKEDANGRAPDRS
jgi:hypothetical protein